jgi:hypothetical protein
MEVLLVYRSGVIGSTDAQLLLVTRLYSGTLHDDPLRGVPDEKIESQRARGLA